MPETVRHLRTPDALVEIIHFSIAHAQDQEFTDRVIETGGFEVWSFAALWRTYDLIVRKGANGELFADPDGPDAAAFMAELDTAGTQAARKWLRSRLLVSDYREVSGRRRDGRIQNVIYVAVGSLLEASRRRDPSPQKRRTKIRLTEGTPT